MNLSSWRDAPAVAGELGIAVGRAPPPAGNILYASRQQKLV
jgi:hypothetical protein